SRPGEVRSQILGRQLLGWHQAVVFLYRNRDSLFALDELEEGDEVLAHELRTDQSADERRILGRTHREVLLDLNDVQAVVVALGLHGENEVDAAPVHADVDLVRLDLADAPYGRPEVVLQRVARRPGKDVDETVVADAGEEGLFVVAGIHLNDAG